MYVALKEILLQSLIACIPAIAYQVCSMKPERVPRAPLVIGLSSAVSMLLCIVFSFFTETPQPFDFRFLPFMLGVMYGGHRIGLLMIGLYLSMLGFFYQDGHPQKLWSDALIYMIPLMFAFINSFRHSGFRQRVAIILSFSFAGIILYSVVYGVLLWSHERVIDGSVLLLMIMLGAAFILTAYLVVYYMEETREKLFLEQGYEIVSAKYREEAEKMNQLINTTPLGVIAVDAQTNITAVNDMMLRSMRNTAPHVTKGDILGRPFRCLVTQVGDFPSLYEGMYRALGGEKVEGIVVRFDEREYVVSAGAIRSQATGAITGAVGMMHDITELSKLRAELGRMERLSLVGQMAASITHEIRNPMAVIRGFMQLLQEKSPDHLREYYRIVMEEIDRANSIINDFLALAQNRIVEKEHVHLHEIIRQLSPLLWADANMRGLEVALKLSEDVPIFPVNVKEMKQLILNLSRNAMEAMEEMMSGGVLTIETRLDGDHVQLRIKDTGPGIPADIVGRLFEPFYTTKSKGTGLGLPLCLSIVEQHDGTIEVNTGEGGTVFEVNFSLAEKARTFLHTPAAEQTANKSQQVQMNHLQQPDKEEALNPV
ncbi:ATP-binding protein [Paenibacillus alvei]|uniref:two-component system sensor histidine kinase NtrB n=1 Tax=Paenibacillus alvei TaxID=44250 RepID=UPI003D26CDEF